MEPQELLPFVTNLDQPVYALRNLPEEVVAVLFAYYSRSQGSLRENLHKLLADQDLAIGEGVQQGEFSLAQQKARDFHEKWVVGYGHSSVAEHAVVHLAVEDVSIIATKIIEDCRLASYTEKSTRYVPWKDDLIYDPEQDEPGLDKETLRVYWAAIHTLMDAYGEVLEQLTERISETADRTAYKTERGFLNACRAQACDTARYLLPAAALTNLGLTCNARTLVGMVNKLLSHPLPEAQRLGRQILDEGRKIVPTLLKYAGENPYRRSASNWAQHALTQVAGPEYGYSKSTELFTGSKEVVPVDPISWLQPLIPNYQDSERLVLAGLLYEQSGVPMEHLLNRLSHTNQEQVIELLVEDLRRRGPHDPVARAYELLPLTNEITVDYGAYRDIQRHRMATQLCQGLTTELGYDIPELVKKHGLEQTYTRAMETAATLAEALRENGWRGADYVVPLGFRVRVLFQWNLRELIHFVELRSAQQGHPSYRRVAQELYRNTLENVLWLEDGLIRVDLNDYELARPEK